MQPFFSDFFVFSAPYWKIGGW